MEQTSVTNNTLTFNNKDDEIDLLERARIFLMKVERKRIFM